MKEKKTKLFNVRSVKLILICVLISLLLTTTLAWIDSLLNAGLEGKSIQVGETSGLALEFDGKIVADYISINDFLKSDDSEFALAECSSVTGISNFFVRDDSIVHADEDGNDILYCVEAVANTNYIEISFNILNNNTYNIDVIFNLTETYITMQDPSINSDAIRLSLEIFEENATENEASYIFGNCPETGDEGYEESEPAVSGNTLGLPVGFFNTLAVVSLSTEAGSVGMVSETATQKVDGFSTYGVSNYDDSYTSCLFDLEIGETKKIVMRVWLEGGSYACTNIGDDDISGSLFDMSVLFTSVDTTTETE